MKKLYAALFMSTMAFAAAPALAQTATNISKESQSFLTKAIEGNLAEIQLGKLAQDKSQSPEVKDFASMLVRDHTDASTKALDVARQINVTAPNQPSKKHLQDIDKMSKLSGAQFDREFVQHMVADHKEEVAEFSKHSKLKADDPTVSFASTILPVLQKHLQAAESLEKGTKK